MNSNNFGQYPMFGHYQQFPPQFTYTANDYPNLRGISMPHLNSSSPNIHSANNFSNDAFYQDPMHLIGNQNDFNQGSPQNSNNSNAGMIPSNDPFLQNASWDASSQNDHQLNEDILDLVACLEMQNENNFYPGPMNDVNGLDMCSNIFSNDYNSFPDSYSPQCTDSICDQRSPSSVFTSEYVATTNSELEAETHLPSVTSSKSEETESNENLPDDVEDGDLYGLKIPDLNRKLRDFGLNKDEVSLVKKGRRQHKNRGYAQTCRQKKVEKKNTMKSQKQILETEINDLRDDVESLKRERDQCKRNYEIMNAQKLQQQQQQQ